MRSSCSPFCAWLLSLSRRSSVHTCVANGSIASLLQDEGSSSAHLLHFLYPHIPLGRLQRLPYPATADTAAVSMDCRLLYNTDFLSSEYTYPGTFLLSILTASLRPQEQWTRIFFPPQLYPRFSLLFDNSMTEKEGFLICLVFKHL